MELTFPGVLNQCQTLLKGVENGINTLDICNLFDDRSFELKCRYSLQ